MSAASHFRDSLRGLRVLCMVLVVVVAGSSLAALPAAAAPPKAETREVSSLEVSGSPDLGDLVDLSEPEGDRLMEPPGEETPNAGRQLSDVLDEEAADKPPVEPGYVEGKSQEVISERNQMASVYANQDGTFTSVIASEPVHYERNGGWDKIDASLAPLAGAPRTWRTVANSHVVTVSAAGVTIDGPDGSVTIIPVGVDLPVPSVSEDGLLVTYRDVWPDADLQYRMQPGAVDEEVVVKSAAAAAAYDFELRGVGLATGEGDRPVLTGGIGKTLQLGTVNVFGPGHQLIDPLAKPTAVVTQEGTAEAPGTMRVGIDGDWLRSLPAEAFPLTIDPQYGFYENVAYSFYQSGACGDNPACVPAYVGNVYYLGNNITWRSVVNFDYAAYLPTLTVASTMQQATLRLDYYDGDTTSRSIAVRRASQYSWCQAVMDISCTSLTSTIDVESLDDTYVDLDVSATLAANWTQGAGLVGWGLSGVETPGVNAGKRVYAELHVTYDRLPIVTGLSPSTPYTQHNSTSGVSLSVTPATEPDAGQTLYYRFVMCSNNASGTAPTFWYPSCTIAADSGWQTGTSSNVGWPSGPGLVASWYNSPRYWGVLVSNSNSPGSGDFVLATPTLSTWELVNQQAPNPTLISPAADFRWASNTPLKLVASDVNDPDGDWIQYRFVIREKGTVGIVARSPWTGFVNPASTANIEWTVPADAPLSPALTYEWTVEIQDEPTYFHWYHYQGAAQGAPPAARTARFEQRLGVGTPSPYQELGAVSVNLATGNLTTAAATPNVSTVGGNLGASLVYNSRGQDTGLRGRFYKDTNFNHAADTGEFVSGRVDKSLNFDWGASGPVTGVGADQFIAQWTGYITVPTSGSYQFWGGFSDEISVSVNGTNVLTASSEIAANIPLENPSYATAYTAAPWNATVNSVSLTAGTPVPVTVTLYDGTGNSWFTLYAKNGPGRWGSFPLSG